MTRTPLGGLVAVAAWGLVGLAFVIGRLGPALLGAALLAVLEGARRRAAARPVGVERMLPPRPRLGAPMTWRVRATTDGQAPIWVEDEVPDALAVTSETHRPGRGEATWEARAEPVRPGTLAWRHVEVRVGDPWALSQAVRRVPLADHLAVEPEPAWAAHGRRIGKRQTVQALAKAPRAMEPQPEVERVREHEPSDRIRDIDWARTARMGSLHTRQRERAAPRGVLVLLDARPSMRNGDHTPKITTAGRIAYGIAAAAEGAGVRAGLVALHEDGVERAADLSGARGLVDAMERLRRLPATEAEGVAHAPPASRAERSFLRRVAPLVGARAVGLDPLDEAVAILCRGDAPRSLVAMVFDAEDDPEGARLAARRLRRHGHDVALVAPATGAHVYRRAEGARHGDELLRWQRHREETARAMARLGARMTVVLPGGEEDAIREVSAWAR